MLDEAEVGADSHLSIRKEVERKYLKVLADRLAEHERGELSLKALQTCFYSVRDTVSGIVEPDDFFEVCDDFEQYFKEHRE
tara:strand:- start:1004 stop:1246 length:243 start_codon:yes stop_codon:yes gene_type:complete